MVQNLSRIHAAAKLFAPAAFTPINYTNGKRKGYVHAHSVDARQQKNEEEIKKNLLKRVAANDPIALGEHGKELYYKGDYDGAFKCLTKAAELGDVEAHFNVSVLYQEGHGVEKDEKKEMYHLEEATIAGHPAARLNLASYERRKGRSDSSVKHLIIAANLGDYDAIRMLKSCYRDGEISKDDYATALHAHKAAVDAMKSPQRNAAAKFFAALS